MTLVVKNVESPDDKRSFEHGDVRLVHLPGATIGQAVLNPGWRWSGDVRPLAGTESCQATHTSIVISGRLRVLMDDGQECELGPGDAHLVGPGHDAWVVGDEACVTIDFIPATQPTATGALEPRSRIVQCPCGVEFRVASEDGLEHLIAAVQQHASGAHGREVSREEIMAS